MEEKILDILEKHYHGRNFIEKRCAKELLALLDVSVSFNEGFEAGWTEATSAAIKEIHKNYKPNVC